MTTSRTCSDMRKGPARAAKAKWIVSDENRVEKQRPKTKKDVVDENSNKKLPAKTPKKSAADENVNKKPPAKTPKDVVDENVNKRPTTRAKRNIDVSKKPAVKAAKSPKIAEQIGGGPRRAPLADRPLTKNKKTPPAVYKNKLIILDDTQMNMSKDELYEFQCDSSETTPPKKLKKEKKKTVKRNKPAIRRKKLSDTAAEEAMKKMLADLEKVRNANLFKKLKTLKQSKNDAAMNHDIPEMNVPETDNFPSPCPSPVRDDDHEGPHNSTLNNHTVHFSNPPATSSMIEGFNNRPSGSPWRVNLDAENKKWRYNFYVKPSMTPAYERDTFHVMGLDDKIQTPAAQPDQNNASNVNEAEPPEVQLKQSSILSFFKESLHKSPKKRATKPVKTVESYNFDDISPIKNVTPEKTVDKPVESVEKRKTPPTLKNCFGFEDDIDGENISPVKKKRVLNIHQRGLLKPIQRARRVLRELNNIPKGPMRITTNEIQNVVQIQNALTQPEKETDNRVDKEPTVPVQTNTSSDSENSITENNSENTTTQESSIDKDIALFEDPCEIKEKEPCEMEVEILHTKPTRKIYQRQKRPPVRFKEVEDYVENEMENNESDESSDYITKSKSTKKAKKGKSKKITKKVDKEFDQWAAGFNSMLEEVEEFTLDIE